MNNIKFNGQEVIRHNKIDELTQYYEMLAPTYPNGRGYEKELRLVHKWADYLENVKKLPFAIINGKDEEGRLRIALLVFGTELKYTRD